MASKLFVGGLSYSTTTESLRGHFGSCGTVESAKIIMDRNSGQSRGFGFVEMATDEEAPDALSRFDGEEFEGRRFKVDLARPMRSDDSR
jgi:RNA recognition motif-containing protein